MDYSPLRRLSLGIVVAPILIDNLKFSDGVCKSPTEQRSVLGLHISTPRIYHLQL